jgi:hypothetical protein
MIRTLRITSVIAVILAVVVLASVLGFLRPTSFLHLNSGGGGDKQIEKILSGPSAVDRFKEKFGTKPPDAETTPPLVKEATLLEGIINPREEAVRPTPPGGSQGKPTGRPVPPVATSAKFDLLGICYSPDAKLSLAYIRLVDGPYQWVGPGSEIGRLTIKEIRRSSIVCVDGGRDVEIPVTPPPETANLLEADNASAMPEPSLPRQAAGSKATASPVKPSVTASPKTVAGTTGPKKAAGATLPSAQISKEEQENLSQLGDKLQGSTGMSLAERDALNNKLISEYKSAQVNPTEADKVESSGETSTAGKDASRDAMREESRRQYLKKLSKPRTSAK